MRIRTALLLFALPPLSPLPSLGAQRQPASRASAPLDVVIVGGRVIDPETNLDAVRTVGVRDGRIVSITEGGNVPDARDTINARGLVVAPGFIDLHRHGIDGLNYPFMAHDGVTTALELEVGTYPVGPWYAAREGKAMVNYGVAVGHIGARRAMLDRDSTAEGAEVIGGRGNFVRAAIDPDRLGELEARLDAGLRDGGLGIGMGINYTPAATRMEILRVFGVAARAGAPVFAHLRYAGLIDSAGGVAALQEVLADAAATGASLHVVHVTSTGLAQTPVLLELIAGARARGVDVTTEAYPYAAASTFLQSAIFDPGFEERLGITYKDILWPPTGERLTAETFAKYRQQGGIAVLFVIPESATDQAYRQPDVIVASDGGFTLVGGRVIGHPRAAGSFARVLGHFVRERGVISLPDAIRKMTLLPAKRLETVAPAMKRKGRVQVGADADLTIFDPARVIDHATFENPVQASRGIVHVLVNGTRVIRDGKPMLSVAPGRAVRGERRGTR
jgi:N-acyl-D-aspartate/D-glutamate deacylase